MMSGGSATDDPENETLDWGWLFGREDKEVREVSEVTPPGIVSSSELDSTPPTTAEVTGRGMACPYSGVDGSGGVNLTPAQAEQEPDKVQSGPQGDGEVRAC